MGSTTGGVVHIVDDDDDVRCGFRRLLRSAGLEVRDYASAESFLDQVEHAAPGCVLLDITMPGLTGPDVLARLKDMRNTLPVVVVSARDSASLQDRVGALGARMFLRKPVDDQALLDAIDWAMRSDSTR